MTAQSVQHQKPSTRFVWAVLVLALCLVLIPVSRTEAWRLATTRQPEPFTELYFADAEHLPRQAVPDQTVVPNFILHNREGHSMPYQYELRVDSDTAATPATAYGTVIVANGDTQTIAAPVAVPTFTNHATLTITIKPTNQQIRYRIERAGDGAGN